MGKRTTYFETVPLDSVVLCAICQQPVDIKHCKTDETGHAVHERCYIAKIAPAAGD